MANSERRVQAHERQKQALQLRTAGVAYEEIAARLGYRGRSGAYAAVMRALKATLQEPADELRKLELERLDKLLLGVWPQAVRGNQGSVDRALRIMERRAKLLGLDAPVKSEWSGPDGGPIEVTDARERLLALINRRAAGGGTPAGCDEPGDG